MLYIILLLILAVLLFGSSAVVGFLGYFLGFAAAAAALFLLHTAYNLDPVVTLAIGIVGFFVLCGILIGIAKLVQPWELKRMKRQQAPVASRRR